MYRGFCALCIIAFAQSAWSQLAIEETAWGYRVLDDSKTALDIQHNRDSDQRSAEPFVRELYDPYGDSFGKPSGPGQAALDWKFHDVTIGNDHVGTVGYGSGTRVFERWAVMESNEENAVLGIQLAWLNLAGEAIAIESTSITVHRAQYQRRAIDIRTRLTNIADAPIGFGKPGRIAAELVVSIDPTRRDALALDARAEWFALPHRYSAEWVAFRSESPARYRPTGFALMAGRRSTLSATHVVEVDKFEGATLGLRASARVEIGVGESAEWDGRIYCFVDSVPAREFDAALARYRAGDTW